MLRDRPVGWDVRTNPNQSLSVCSFIKMHMGWLVRLGLGGDSDTDNSKGDIGPTSVIMSTVAILPICIIAMQSFPVLSKACIRLSLGRSNLWRLRGVSVLNSRK